MFIKKIIPKRLKDKIWNAIDTIKIYFGPYLVKKVDLDSFISKYSQLRIAFVKQEIHTDLYTNTVKDARDLIFSSIHRSGPVALFTKFNAVFFIVKVTEDPESNYWKYRPIDCGGPSIEKFIACKEKSIYNKNGDIINKIPQKNYAVNPHDIDWNNFDIVITCDISIPERIVSKYSKVKWAYMFVEPTLRFYKYSHKGMLHNYNYFLNQKFRSIKLNPKPKYHEIDFPYHLQYYGVFHDLLRIKTNHFVKEGIFLENWTSTGITEKEIEQLKVYGEVRFPREELLQNVIEKVLRSKYYFSLSRGIGSKIWGNGIIEAIACGCLAFGNPIEYGNKDLFTNFTKIKSFNEFIKKIDYLEKNPQKYVKEINIQRKLLDYLCFYRPMKELIEKK